MSKPATTSAKPSTPIGRKKLPKVRPALSAAPPRADPSLPAPPRAAPPAARGGEKSAAARPLAGKLAPPRRADGNLAIREVFAPLPEGFRVLWLGDSGMGKSTAQRLTTQAALAAGLIVVAHDDVKIDPQIPGAKRANVAELEARPLEGDEDAGAIVFRGDPYRGIVVEVEEVAGFALNRLARNRVRVVLAIDELDRAVTRGGRELVSDSLRYALTQGRALGLSVTATTQSPARAPKEVIDQATAIGLFRLGPRALTYLDNGQFFEQELLDAVPNLGVGEFVLHRPGRAWNRTVYKFAV